MGWAEARRQTILCVAFVALTIVPASAAPTNKDAEFTRAAMAAVERIEREDGFSGVILVARGDHILLREAAGYADRERNIRNTPDTKFPLESVTKQFTATAIMLLVQDRKVSLNDPISKYYGASPTAWSKVTIKHLLTHGSGIEDYWVRRPEAREALNAGKLFQSYGDLIRLASSDPLAFEPGTGHEYSNTGYALLTAAIERASGQSYREFLEKRIFAPPGMLNTGYGSIPGNVLRDYVRSPKGEWQLGSGFDLQATGGFGGIYSTVDDMLIWSRALETDTMLSTASKAAMFTDYGYNYGFGWRFAPKFGRQLIWHTGGGGGGYASIFDTFPAEKVTVVAMTNNAGTTGSTARLLIEGKMTTFPANAMREVVEEVERLYFGRAPY